RCVAFRSRFAWLCVSPCVCVSPLCVRCLPLQWQSSTEQRPTRGWPSFCAAKRTHTRTQTDAHGEISPFFLFPCCLCACLWAEPLKRRRCSLATILDGTRPQAQKHTRTQRRQRGGGKRTRNQRRGGCGPSE